MKLKSFVWLLSTGLEATFGVCPIIIITYKDVVITNAVALVFLEVNHYFMLHIEKKVSKYLSYFYHEHIDFKNQFYKCIYQFITVKEFESDWEAIILKYGLQDISGWRRYISFEQNGFLLLFVTINVLK